MFILHRRRVDVPNTPWESCEISLNVVEDETFEDFIEYHSSFYTGDGFHPGTYKEAPAMHEWESILRRESIEKIYTFYEHDLPVVNRAVKRPCGVVWIHRLQPTRQSLGHLGSHDSFKAYMRWTLAKTI
jgi:hypothetical protein